jgi:hypothetical protein
MNNGVNKGWNDVVASIFHSEMDTPTCLALVPTFLFTPPPAGSSTNYTCTTQHGVLSSCLLGVAEKWQKKKKQEKNTHTDDWLRYSDSQPVAQNYHSRILLIEYVGSRTSSISFEFIHRHSWNFIGEPPCNFSLLVL